MATADVETATASVRKQYEDLPYPERDPQEEKTRLLVTKIDDLGALNFYCYRGRRDFRNEFRVLIAGGGTGDSTIYLAEQLRQTNAKIVHLDLSEASIHVAQQRANLRGLKNIEWVHASLLDLPQLGFSPFDYINCSGVLHHLSDPSEGLEALKSVLKPDGGLGLMLYGRYGRTGVYHIQELMRLVNHRKPDSFSAVENTRRLLGLLPETNWFNRGRDLITQFYQTSDPECYDLFLHSVDQSFSVLELHQLLQKSGLHLVEFVPDVRALYDPARAFREPRLLERIQRLPRHQQQAAAELYWGTIRKHDFWASPRSDSVANPREPENVPFFSQVADLEKLSESFRKHQKDKWSMTIEHPGGIEIKITIEFDQITRLFFELIDGKRTLGEIVELISKQCGGGTSTDDIWSRCLDVFEKLRSYDLLFLRHRTTAPIQITLAA